MPEQEIKSVPYFYNQLDSEGYVHSIDMLSMSFFLSCSVESAVESIKAIFQRYISDWSVERNTKLNCKPSSNYDFYNNHLWGMGIHFSVGKWQRFDRDDKQWIAIPALTVKVNPNKYFSLPIWSSGFSPYLHEISVDGFLDKYDYAIDVPVDIDSVVVHSRKTPGLYNGTRYWGMRNCHGRLKVYDKGKESGLDNSLTRIEWTEKNTMKRSFDDVFTINGRLSDDFDVLPKNTRNLVLLLLKVISLGGDISDDLTRLDRRMRKTIEPYVLGANTQLFVDGSILDCLLSLYCSDMSLVENRDCVKVSLTAAGFVKGDSPDDGVDNGEQFSLPF